MTTLGQHAPTDPVAAFTAELRRLEARITELERIVQPAAQVGNPDTDYVAIFEGNL